MNGVKQSKGKWQTFFRSLLNESLASTDSKYVRDITEELKEVAGSRKSDLSFYTTRNTTYDTLIATPKKQMTKLLQEETYKNILTVQIKKKKDRYILLIEKKQF